MAADELFGPDGTQAFSLDGPRPPRPPADVDSTAGDTLGDALGGLVTGPAFEPGDWSGDETAGAPDSVYSTGITPFPAAPDQQQLRSAVDKAMMTGPPTNPLRISRPTSLQRVRPAPTVTTATAASIAASTNTAPPNIAPPNIAPTTNIASAHNDLWPSGAPSAPNTAPLPQLAAPLPSVPRATPAPTLPPPSPMPTPAVSRTQSTRMPSSAPPQPAVRPLRSSLAGRPTLKSRHPVVSTLLKLVVPIIFVVLVLLLHGFGGTLSNLFQ